MILFGPYTLASDNAKKSFGLTGLGFCYIRAVICDDEKINVKLLELKSWVWQNWDQTWSNLISTTRYTKRAEAQDKADKQLIAFGATIIDDEEKWQKIQMLA